MLARVDDVPAVWGDLRIAHLLHVEILLDGEEGVGALLLSEQQGGRQGEQQRDGGTRACVTEAHHRGLMLAVIGFYPAPGTAPMGGDSLPTPTALQGMTPIGAQPFDGCYAPVS
jgi:hypothetical protein